MKIWKISLALVAWFSLALSLPSTSEGSDDDPPSESTDLKLVWLDDLTMSLHLPNTTQLTLLLSPASNIPGEPTPCLFSGTVEQDQRSVVAVTGCKESPETDVTIASRLVPRGLVDLVIVNGSTYSIKDDTSLRRNRQLEVGEDDMVIPPASVHSAVHHMAADSAVPGQVVLETYLRYDNTLLRKFGYSHTSTKQWLSRVVEMARPRLLHSSLDTGLQLQLLGEMKHHNENIQADRTTIYRLARNPKEKGLTSYFGYQLGGGTVGIAFVGAACRQDGYAVNINELYSSYNSEVKTARTWVHELGHNVGMRHDFDASHGGQSGPCNNQGLMSYGNSPDKWSTCSNADFAAWFRRQGNVCLKSESPDCPAPKSGLIASGSNVAGGCTGYSTTGWMDCARKCTANPSCKAWTLDKTSNRCWLKTNYKFVGNHVDWSWGMPCKDSGPAPTPGVSIKLHSDSTFDYYKVQVDPGVTMVSGATTTACRKRGMQAACVGPSGCRWNDESKCEVTPLHTGCGWPMMYISQATCNGQNDPSKCAKMEGVFQYMKGWFGSDLGWLGGRQVPGKEHTSEDGTKLWAYCLKAK